MRTIMNVQLPANLGNNYKSPSQKIRVITEIWARQNVFCPSCLQLVSAKPHNFPATDFTCVQCEHSFELKSTKGAFGKKVVDGAYSTLSARIHDGTQPNLLLLAYTSEFQVSGLVLIPKVFLTQQIVEKRKPLAETARRRGWVGCNLLIGNVPIDGQIVYVKGTRPLSHDQVQHQWEQSRFIETIKPEARGWLIAVMSCVRRLGKPRFNLQEMYLFESALQAQFPNNRNIRPKIRQQLQILRDKGWVDFQGNGNYQLCS